MCDGDLSPWALTAACPKMKGTLVTLASQGSRSREEDNVSLQRPGSGARTYWVKRMLTCCQCPSQQSLPRRALSPCPRCLGKVCPESEGSSGRAAGNPKCVGPGREGPREQCWGVGGRQDAVRPARLPGMLQQFLSAAWNTGCGRDLEPWVLGGWGWLPWICQKPGPLVLPRSSSSPATPNSLLEAQGGPQPLHSGVRTGGIRAGFKFQLGHLLVWPWACCIPMRKLSGEINRTRQHRVHCPCHRAEPSQQARERQGLPLPLGPERFRDRP